MFMNAIPASPYPHSLTEFAFRTREALHQGVTPGRLRRRNHQAVSRGIRLKLPAPDDTRQYVQHLACVVAETHLATVSHLSAARIHGLPIPGRYLPIRANINGRTHALDPWSAAHISVPKGRRAPRRRGVLGYSQQLAAADVVLVNGIQVTSLGRTIVDLARWLTVTDLIVVMDHVFSSGSRSIDFAKTARLSKAAFEKYLESQSGRQGIRKIRLALERAVEAADSPPETRLRLALQDAGLPTFQANVPILDEQEQPITWSDLSNTEYRICLEYEGAGHLTGRQLHLDTNRDLHVQMHGWMQVRITKVDMRDPQNAVNKVRSALLRRGWSPNRP